MFRQLTLSLQSKIAEVMISYPAQSKQNKDLKVLFEYQGHRSILKCKRSKILEDIGKGLADLTHIGLDPQTSASESVIEVHTLQSRRRVLGKPKPGVKCYLLQRYVKDWKTFINIDSIEQIKNLDTLTVQHVTDGLSTGKSPQTAETAVHVTKSTEAKVVYICTVCMMLYIIYYELKLSLNVPDMHT